MPLSPGHLALHRQQRRKQILNPPPGAIPPCYESSKQEKEMPLPPQAASSERGGAVGAAQGPGRLLSLPALLQRHSVSLAADSALAEAPPPACLGRNKTCRPAGWVVFFRWLRCPCGKPRNPRPSKAGHLKTISLNLPVPPQQEYQRPSNLVVTSKYTPWDFLFRACILQFRRAINLFFLAIVVLIAIGYFHPNLWESPYQPWGTLSVLIVVVGVTMIFDGVDDFNRHLQDHKANSSSVVSFDPETGTPYKTTWGALSPGDIVFLYDRDHVPADVILLHSARDGAAYVETSGIDGETNLKIKRAPPELVAHISNSTRSWPMLSGRLEYEEPNPFLSFTGTLHLQGTKPVPIAFESLVLRGSEIRNTEWCLVLVAYAGHETKLVLSKKSTPSKFASLDLLTNRMVVVTVLEMFVFVATSLGVLFVDTVPTQDIWYFQGASQTSGFSIPGQLSYTFTFIIIYSGVVPISLYVVVELANVMQSLLLMLDLDMYDPVTNTAASTKATNLISEIGQVSHVFSDKTGTLTQNVMRLVGLSVGGRRFGISVPDAQPDAGAENAAPPPPPVPGLGQRKLDEAEIFKDLLDELDESPAAREMLMSLAICHTVVMDTDRTGRRKYNAEGPDEEALVKAAKALGFELWDTAGGAYTVKEHRSGAQKKFAVLAVLGFNSDRKRMSIVVRDEDTGVCTLWCKGADSVLLELAASQADDEEKANTASALAADLTAFAQNGLRTLLVAKRTLSEDSCREFIDAYEQAKAVVGPSRIQALDHAYAMVESQLEIIGATAIEDALQEGVPQAIQTLRDARIKVWVLTGDKVDTAINIAFSSRLLDSRMTRIHLDSPVQADLLAKISASLSALETAAKGPIEGVAEVHGLALVVTGKAMELLLVKQKGNVETQTQFVKLASACSVVLACRVSPAQKALIVRAASVWLPGRARPPVSLAIGDGANDVAMIQEARVGVGISGKEGLQAANNADFAVAQFKFLIPLLFKHGRWSYRRNAKLILYVCYSWQLLNWGIFFYSFQSMQSGQSILVNTYYGTIFAWICNYIIVAIAWFDRDVGFATVLRNPQAYDVGRLNKDVNTGQVLLGVFLRPLVHAGILYLFLMIITPNVFLLDILGSSFFMILVILCTLRQAMVALTWTWVVILAFVAFFIIYPVAMIVIDTSPSLTGPGEWLMQYEPTAYAATSLAVGSVFIVEYGIGGARRLWRPRKIEVLMEIDRCDLSGVGDAWAAIEEGGDRVFVMPAKELRRALSRRFKGGKGQEEELLGSRRHLDVAGNQRAPAYNFSGATPGKDEAEDAEAGDDRPSEPGEV